MLMLLSLLLLVLSADRSIAVEVGVYYTSKCPTCQKYFDDNILPIIHEFNNIIKAGIVMHPVPYGNTVETITQDGRYHYRCQHGPEECYLNRVEACGLSLIQDSQADIWAPWISCVNESSVDVAKLWEARQHLERAVAETRIAIAEARMAAEAAKAAADAAAHGDVSDAAREAAKAAAEAAKSAIDASHASAEATKASAAAAAGGKHAWLMCPLGDPNHQNILLLDILVCSITAIGENLQHMMKEQTPEHDHVPWITFDGEHMPDAEENLKCALCKHVTSDFDEFKQFCSNSECPTSIVLNRKYIHNNNDNNNNNNNNIDTNTTTITTNNNNNYNKYNKLYNIKKNGAAHVRRGFYVVSEGFDLGNGDM